MDTPSRSAGGQDLPHPANEPRDRSPSRRRLPWFIGAVVLLLAKSESIGWAIHHRSTLIVVLALALVGAVVRPRPVVIAATVAPLLALALDPHSLLAGVAVGVGGFVLLMVLFVGIATVLHARQARSWEPGRVRRN
jgi:hypothetical protein